MKNIKILLTVLCGMFTMTGFVYAATDYNSSRSNKSEDSGVIAPGDVSDLIDKTKLEIMSDVEGEIAKQRAMGDDLKYEAVVTIKVKLIRISDGEKIKAQLPEKKPKIDRAVPRKTN